MICILLVSFFTLGAGWSLTTAPGGSPDEVQHAFRAIAVWDGQLLLEPLPTGGASVRIPQVWNQIQVEITCFTGNQAATAACAADWPTDDGVTALLGNSAGRYNPVYYLLIGLPFQMFGPETGLYVARLLSCLLTAVLLTLAASALLVRGGSVLARIGLVAALTPMALFLGGTVNPSGMEIAGAIAGWVGLLLLARNPDHPAVRYFAVVTAVGLCAMVVSRPASYLWLAVLGVVFLIAAGRRSLGRLVRRPAVLIAAAAVAVVAVCCLLWNYLAMTSDTSTGAPLFGGRAEGFLQSYRSSAAWWEQQIGVLGWLDTPLPTAALWGTLLIVGVIVVPAAVGSRPAMRIALLAALVAAVGVPIIAQTFLFPTMGLVWQGRYGMPLTVGVVLVAGIALDETSVFDRAIAGRLMGLCLCGWALIGITVGFYNLQRYATGSAEAAGYELLWQPTAWQPPSGNALAFGVLALGYLAVALSLGRLAPSIVVEVAPEPNPSGPEPATEVPADFDDEQKAAPPR